MIKISKKELNLAIIFTLLQVTHVLDFTVMIPLAPIFIKEFNLSAAEYSYLVSSYNLSSGLITLCAGNLIDLTERKKFLLLSYMGFIVATFICALTDNYFGLLTARITAGAFGGLTTTATFAFLGDQVREEVRGEATGIVLSSFAITSVIGIPLGLHLATIYHWKVVFLFIVCLSLIVLTLALKFVPKVSPARSQRLGIMDTLKIYLKIISKKNEFLGLVLMSLVGMSSFFIIPFIAPFIVGNLGLEQSDLKYTYLIGGVFSLLTGRIVGILCDKFGNMKIYIIFAILSIVPGLLLTHLTTASFTLVMFTTTLFMMLFNSRFIPVMSLMNTIPAPEYRGVYFSLSQSVRTLSIAFATWMAGLMVTVSDDHQLVGFRTNGWLSITFIILSFLVLKNIRLRTKYNV